VLEHRRFVIGVVAAGLAGLVAATAGGAPRQHGVSGKIQIIAKWTGDEQKSFEAVLAPFKKANPAITINYQGAGDNTPQVVSTAIAGGNPPDIATMPQPGTMADFAKRGALKPITFAKSSIAAHYKPVWLQLGSVNGKLYGLFFKGADKSTVWYAVQSFKNAGVSPPTTWPQFTKAIGTVKASGTTPLSVGGADGWTLTDLFENIYLRQAGPAKYDALSKHKIKWTDASVIKALNTMGSILKSGNVAGGTSGALQTDFPTSVSNVFSSNPKASMIAEGDFVPGVVASKNPLKPVSGYNVFPFPSIGNTANYVEGGGDMLMAFKDTPAIRALVQYLATGKAQTIWAKRGGYTAPSKTVPLSAYPDAITRVVAGAVGKAKVFRFDMSDLQPASFGGTVGQGEFKLFQDFLQNPSNSKGIAKQLETAATKAYKAGK
jgi:alpha-glucoside transport system substrate-binding protein